MDVKPGRFVRKPFFVDAVEVTIENMADVAAWCGGEIKKNNDAETTTYIEVNVQRPLHPNQTRAFPGCWILRSGSSGNNFKVYTNKAFKAAFDPAQETATV